MPTAAEFMRALKAAMPLPQSCLNMLQFHYSAPNRTVTPAILANGVGYKTFRAANLHYGKLARLLRGSGCTHASGPLRRSPFRAYRQ